MVQKVQRKLQRGDEERGPEAGHEHAPGRQDRRGAEGLEVLAVGVAYSLDSPQPGWGREEHGDEYAAGVLHHEALRDPQLVRGARPRWQQRRAPLGVGRPRAAAGAPAVEVRRAVEVLGDDAHGEAVLQDVRARLGRLPRDHAECQGADHHQRQQLEDKRLEPEPEGPRGCAAGDFLLRRLGPPLRRGVPLLRRRGLLHLRGGGLLLLRGLRGLRAGLLLLRGSRGLGLRLRLGRLGRRLLAGCGGRRRSRTRLVSLALGCEARGQGHLRGLLHVQAHGYGAAHGVCDEVHARYEGQGRRGRLVGLRLCLRRRSILRGAHRLGALCLGLRLVRGRRLARLGRGGVVRVLRPACCRRLLLVLCRLGLGLRSLAARGGGLLLVPCRLGPVGRGLLRVRVRPALCGFSTRLRRGSGLGFLDRRQGERVRALGEDAVQAEEREGRQQEGGAEEQRAAVVHRAGAALAGPARHDCCGEHPL
mmetsp:Transcript_75090/g.233101  ORF Transcript_75090/g.233101 Transcript_75090/m.233101 type:complete len:476 (-) Transcript_75090:43-1470(-)